MKNTLKAFRASQPFNRVSTSAARTFFSTTGMQSEFIIKHLHRIGSVRSKLPNGKILRLWSRGDDWVSNQVFWRGWSGYESETAPLFYRLAQRSQTTFDIGSFVGYFTLLAGHANNSGRVFAFEPMPMIFRRLQHHVSLNGLKRRVRCVQGAVGASDGTAEFFHQGHDLPTSSSLSAAFMTGTANLQSSTVPVIALDDFVRDNDIQRVDLMKIDTESTEPDVLRGAIETLRRDHPTIICEVLPWGGRTEALEEILAPLGYRFYLLTSKGPQPRAKIEGDSQWLNYLFTILPPDEVAIL